MVWETEEAQAMDLVEAAHIDTVIAASELGHELWELARPALIARYWSGEEAPVGRHAEARLLWSSAALGVRFICRQAEPLIISNDPQTKRKTIGLWDRDVCEIFVAPNAEEPERYFEFEAAPTGEWLDLAIYKIGEERETEWEFNSGMTAAARTGESHITIAMSIPWEAFGRRPEAGVRWRANLTRCVGTGETRGYLAWRPTYTERPDFHVPEAFGEMIFKA